MILYLMNLHSKHQIKSLINKIYINMENGKWIQHHQKIKNENPMNNIEWKIIFACHICFK